MTCFIVSGKYKYNTSINRHILGVFLHEQNAIDFRDDLDTQFYGQVEIDEYEVSDAD
jgi:hypothetical protein